LNLELDPKIQKYQHLANLAVDELIENISLKPENKWVKGEDKNNFLFHTKTVEGEDGIYVRVKYF
jgi:hypothetical protein